jgi:hypothetical protein
VNGPLIVTVTQSLNRDRYYLRRINCDVQVHPPVPAARLYKAPSSSPSGRQFTNQVLLFRRPFSSLSICCLLLHLHRLHRAHGTGESWASGTSPCWWDPARDRRTIRFLGSVFTWLLTPVRLLPLRRLRANDYFIYSESALRSSACIDCVQLLRLRSLTMGDNGNSGDAVTQTCTWYFLKQMFIFISCIIMNIAMFNCGLNIHTCTWIVSLTITLKCLLNYGIKIC